MQLEDAKWVNVKEKFEIAYALCPRCPRCSENFTRTDALTRHLRSPCSGGSVGAAVDDGGIAATFQQATPVHFVEIKDAKSVKEMLDAQTVQTSNANGQHHHPHPQQQQQQQQPQQQHHHHHHHHHHHTASMVPANIHAL
ncbi:hypothetical protein FRC17_005169, partial [Serendipita sp. 399]